jgi:hypothetical protein
MAVGIAEVLASAEELGVSSGTTVWAAIWPVDIVLAISTEAVDDEIDVVEGTTETTETTGRVEVDVGIAVEED